MHSDVQPYRLGPTDLWHLNMKLALLSDLHLSVHPMSMPDTDADVLVLAGDIWRPADAIAWAKQSAIPSIYVAGNHEFYGSDLVSTMKDLRYLSQESRIRVLEQDEWHYKGVRFLGCTLWSDYRLFDSAEQRTAGLAEAQEMMRDFSRIRISPEFSDKFTPAVSQMLFDSSVAWLDQRFREPHEGPTVVVTHFAPSRNSISHKFEGSPLNACFISALEERIQHWQPELWLHGHTHDSFDYVIGQTRIVCNPRGYARNGVVENPSFNPQLVISLEETLASKKAAEGDTCIN